MDKWDSRLEAVAFWSISLGVVFCLLTVVLWVAVSLMGWEV